MHPKQNDFAHHTTTKRLLLLKFRQSFSITKRYLDLTFSRGGNSLLREPKRHYQGLGRAKNGNAVPLRRFGAAISVEWRCDISEMAMRYQWNGVAISMEWRCDISEMAMRYQ